MRSAVAFVGTIKRVALRKARQRACWQYHFFATCSRPCIWNSGRSIAITSCTVITAGQGRPRGILLVGLGNTSIAPKGAEWRGQKTGQGEVGPGRTVMSIVLRPRESGPG